MIIIYTAPSYTEKRRHPRAFSGEKAIEKAEKALAADVEADLQEWFTHDYGGGNVVVEYETDYGKDVSYLRQYSSILEEFERHCRQEEASAMEIDEHFSIEAATPREFIMLEHDDLFGDVTVFRYEIFEAEIE